MDLRSNTDQLLAAVSSSTRETHHQQLLLLESFSSSCGTFLEISNMRNAGAQFKRTLMESFLYMIQRHPGTRSSSLSSLLCSQRRWCCHPNSALRLRTTTTRVAAVCPLQLFPNAWMRWISITDRLKTPRVFFKVSKSTWSSCLSFWATDREMKKRALWLESEVYLII